MRKNEAESRQADMGAEKLAESAASKLGLGHIDIE